MDIIELIKSAFLGLVEGITEWLPISSTGHMILVDEFIKLDVSQEFWNMFQVVIQLGAILAVCVLFFHQLNPFSPSKGSDGRRATWVLWGKIVVACIPAAVIGFLFDDFMEEHLYNAYVVAGALIVYGIAFIVIETWRARRLEARVMAAGMERSMRPAGAHFASAPAPAAEPTEGGDFGAITNLDELPWGTALGIGCFQVLALIPGTSRSGSTIIGGLLLGTTRSVAAEFTFFLAIPVMFGASALKLVKYVLVDGGGFGTSEIAIMVVGCVVAFLVSLVAIKWLMGFVRRHTFTVFGVYRIILGALVLLYFLVLA
ncbi:undecaprenyl-diphosphate phosphatase [Enorma burkinafasonensis]|uniref:undecaprenyl-diphosphate phosphatase n=1 Tax=Enorma burkinafasonensis TaxID=2590867 RepID=UPI0026F06A4C|nr:undecaprenyl-diphosphate phosphatase [Enorma burkinafasonensis]MCI7730950.1 undecaprenyl-diphosphate phosphatase [Enorma burkinafasonensis]